MLLCWYENYAPEAAHDDINSKAWVIATELKITEFKIVNL